MTPTTRRLINRYAPFGVIAVALALVIAVAPTVTPSGQNGFANYRPGQGASPAGGAESASNNTAATTSTTALGGQASAGANGVAAVRSASGPGQAAARGTAAAAAPGADCSRQAILGPKFPCKAPFSGPNGGATYAKGVTANQVNVLYYFAPQNPATQQILAAGGAATPAQQDHTIEVYKQFFDKYFQTYGRKVNLSIDHSQGQAQNSTSARADAVAADQQYHSFTVINDNDANFVDESARRGMINIGGNQLPQSFYAAHAPFVYGILPSADTTDAHIAEYIGKRLGAGSSAQWAGSQSVPPIQGTPRKYGIVYPSTNSDGTPASYAKSGDDLKARLAKYGISVAAEIGYSENINEAQTQATNIVQQLKAAGVTTVLCQCDPIAPIFFTQTSSSQAYYPEWFMTGYLLMDYFLFGRLYDQSQWAHSFGVSSLPVQNPHPDQTVAWKAYKAIDPSTDPPTGYGAIYTNILLTYVGIEGAGPTLNPKTFADALFQIHLTSSSPDSTTFYYSPDDYGGIKDMQEIWWNAQASDAPDGKPGNYSSVDGGYRYTVGNWPATPPQVFKTQCLSQGSCGGPKYPPSS